MPVPYADERGAGVRPHGERADWAEDVWREGKHGAVWGPGPLLAVDGRAFAPPHRNQEHCSQHDQGTPDWRAPGAPAAPGYGGTPHHRCNEPRRAGPEATPETHVPPHRVGAQWDR